MPDVLLRGCRPEPLSDYLKSLALLRLVAQQEDAEARGWWEDDRFILSSRLDGDGLVAFLADRYRPTPLVAPWNGGSGFYPGDSREGMNAIVANTSPRLSEYRTVINMVTALPEMPREPRFVGEILCFLQGLVQSEGDSSEPGGIRVIVETLNRCNPNVARFLGADLNQVPLVSLPSDMKKRQADPLVAEWYKAFGKGMTHFSRMQRSADKELLLSSCRSRLPDSVLPWLDATFALTEFDGPAYGAVLGSGGNEGRLDYTNNFMQHIALLLLGDRDFSIGCLRAALFSTTIDSLPRSSIGQFQPGRAGGFNQGPGVEHKDVPINPWDFVLSMEGAVVLASSVARRQGSTRTAATSPFTVSIARVGYQSSNSEDSGRAESWLPLWGRPARYAEIAGLLREGRATVGRRSAGNGIDMARAVATFGVDRGITSFVRYGFLKRRGDSFVALPMGRIQVRSLPAVTLLNDVDRILFRVSALARGRNAPVRLLAAHRKLEEALFHASLRGTPDSFQAVVVALGHVVRWMGHVAGSESGRGRLSGPLPASLSLDWLNVMDDGSVEYRLALALASIHGREGGVGPIAANLLPLDPVRPSRWASGAGQEAWHGRSLPARMAATLERRLNDGGLAADGGVPLASVIEATPLDVAEFLAGRTDDGRIEDLVWGMSLIKWRTGSRPSMPPSNAPEQPLSRAWCLLKLLFLPPNRLGTTVRPEPRIVPMLASGDRGLANRAIELAHRRLLVDGLRPRRFDPHVDFDPERMAAALLVPTGAVLRWRGRVLKPDDLES